MSIIGLYKSEHGEPVSNIYHFADEDADPYCGARISAVARPVEDGRPCPHCYGFIDRMKLFVCNSWGRPTKTTAHKMNGDGPVCGELDASKMVLAPAEFADRDCRVCHNNIRRSKEFECLKSAKLTKNGAGSLIITVPHRWWRDAGIDHDEPGSVAMVYDPSTKTATVDFRQDRREL